MSWSVRGMSSPQELVARLHRVHHDGRQDTVHDTDLVDDRGLVGADHHRESLVELEHSDRMRVGVSDVFIANTVLAGALGDDQLDAHHHKLPCCMAHVQKRCSSCNREPRHAAAKRVLRRYWRLLSPAATASVRRFGSLANAYRAVSSPGDEVSAAASSWSS